MTQEARIHPRIAKRERLPVYSYRTILQGSYEVVGSIHQLVQIAAVNPPLSLRGCNKHFERRIARARAHASETGINAVTAFFHCNERIRHAET
ncbi:hypothetical protein SAMN05414139_09966 [Burkholderia sp. D7]|nr:hypothetical protein SAMN05414139_09966 [Burkholderia sp. D7]